MEKRVESAHGQGKGATRSMCREEELSVSKANETLGCREPEIIFEHFLAMLELTLEFIS